MASYWCCCRLQPQREGLALHCLALAGYETYLPRLRERRSSRGRRIIATPPLFPGYAFVLIEAQWYAAAKTAGVVSLIMSGEQPARLADGVIAEIRGRERNGLIDLPSPPSPSRPRLRPGEPVSVLHGPFIGRLAIYVGMKPRERVEIMLRLLGSEQRVILAEQDIKAIR